MTSIGFTGSREGMTEAQQKACVNLLKAFQPEHVHHGDCWGSDHLFHMMSTKIDTIIHVYPPTNDKYRAFCEGDVVYHPQSYLKRNKSIVLMSDILIATPSGPEKLRSGTWSTIRFARKKEKHIYIIFPDGVVSEENA